MEPIDLPTDGAVFTVLHQATQIDAVRIALAAFIEGRGLDQSHAYRLEITGARLVPVEKPE